jgi:hypothetical protein
LGPGWNIFDGDLRPDWNIFGRGLGLSWNIFDRSLRPGFRDYDGGLRGDRLRRNPSFRNRGTRIKEESQNDHTPEGEKITAHTYLSVKYNTGVSHKVG